MKVQEWTEVGGTWDAGHGLLDEDQVAECGRADVAEPFPSPMPTRMVSNGEHMPGPQTSKQTRVERRIREFSADASKRLGIDRRSFLASSGGMVAAFLAMNEVFGRMFNVDPVELFESAAYAPSAAPRDLLVFDDQLHFVRGSQPGAPANRAIAQGPSAASRFESNPHNPRGMPDEHGNPWGVWNPALAGLPVTAETAHLTQFIKDVYLDSQVTIGLLSNVTAFMRSSRPSGDDVPG